MDKYHGMYLLVFKHSLIKHYLLRIRIPLKIYHIQDFENDVAGFYFKGTGKLTFFVVYFLITYNPNMAKMV